MNTHSVSGAGSSRDIRGKLSMARLPSMPQILLRLLDLCHQEDVNMADLAAVVSRDAGMVAKVLGVASSAAFHGRSRPSSLEQCLAVLGMNAIKTIVINESVMQVFNRFTSGRGVDLKRFWGHSLRCALIARELARRMEHVSPEEAYLGGLLHDVGQLAILATDPETYSRMFYEFQDNHNLCARELETFALTHAEVGAWLVEKWELDSFLCDSVLYHHETAERVASAHPLVRIVLLANRLSMIQGREPTAEENELVSQCGAAIADLGGLLEAVEIELVTTAEQLGIELAPPEQSRPADAAAKESEERETAKLAARIQDILLVDQVLSAPDAFGASESETHSLARAMKVLFDVEPALWFESVGDKGDRFEARPLALKSSRLAQLEFVRSKGGSVLAGAVERGPVLLMRGTPGPHILDDQMLRMLGGEGVLYLPLRSRQTCRGVLVLRIESAERAATLQARMACLEYFGRVSADLLAGGADQSTADPEGLRARMNSLVHEISNPLSIIRNYLHILEAECAEKNIGQPEIGVVRGEIDRVGKILQSVRNEKEKSKPTGPAPVNLNRVIEDLVSLCRGSLAVNTAVEIKLDLAGELPEIASDADGLKQLLLNLIKNSIEAMPHGGTIRVTTAPWGSGSGASHAEIAVEDTGPGIPKEIMSRLYQQVASTKGGQHQGLGLAIVGQLVRDLRGLINCRSSAQGTRFQVLLPFSGK